MYKVMLFWKWFNKILMIKEILGAIYHAISSGLGSNIYIWTIKSYWDRWETKCDKFMN